MSNYYRLSASETLEKLRTDIQESSHQEAKERLKQHWLNQLEEKWAKHPVGIFLKQFEDPIILILVGAMR
jgi:magnesium-transporting ATPase (P-type)